MLTQEHLNCLDPGWLKSQADASLAEADQLHVFITSQNRDATPAEQKRFDELLDLAKNYTAQADNRDRLQKAVQSYGGSSRMTAGKLQAFKGPDAVQVAHESGEWIRNLVTGISEPV